MDTEQKILKIFVCENIHVEDRVFFVSKKQFKKIQLPEIFTFVFLSSSMECIWNPYLARGPSFSDLT